MFIDKAKIFVQAGDGGHGMSSFRREKYVPRGGPSGGDGGRGGSVILRVDESVNTLIDFRYKRKFKAAHGSNGQTNTMIGRDSDDIIVKVPPGTLVRDEANNKLLADLVAPGDQVVIARGGRGGRGNARFANSVNRAPTFSEKGEPGESLSLLLELKVLADVGLAGYPSVGKSSLVASVSAAQPEIADYHFTTLTPVLGVVRLDEGHSFVLADIPGLIEGAHAGKGLGHEFLRHLERTKVLIHVLDAAGLEGRDPIDDYHTICEELSQYNQQLLTKPQLIAANKIDLPAAVENLSRITAYMQQRGLEVMPISAATGAGVQELMWRAYQLLTQVKDEPVVEPVYTYSEAEEPELAVIKRAEDGAFVVESKRLERLVAMTHFENDEALRRFQRIWRTLEIDQLLTLKGIKDGDTVRIRDMEFIFKQ